jgi:hypothetical protein
MTSSIHGDVHRDFTQADSGRVIISEERYYYELSDMRADLMSIREGLSNPEPGLSEDLTAAIALLECAEDKLFSLLPREEFASPT